jgi:hypothetical protein
MPLRISGVDHGMPAGPHRHSTTIGHQYTPRVVAIGGGSAPEEGQEEGEQFHHAHPSLHLAGAECACVRWNHVVG